MPSWLEPGDALRRRRASNTLWSLLLVVALLGVTALVASRLDPLPPRFTGAARASDGDSLWVGTDRVRLRGLDAPELDQVCWRPDGSAWPCGRAARDEMSRLLAAGSIDCRPEGTDRFRTHARALRRGRYGPRRRDRDGGPRHRHGCLRTRGRAAREARRGIWDGRFTEPRTWRDEGPAGDPGPGWLEQVWTWLRELTGARALR